MGVDYMTRFGLPLEILSNRGPGFKGDLVGELMKKLKIKRRHSTPYYSQCNGLVKKVNGMICKIITKQVVSKPKEWDKHLEATLWSYRTSFRTSLSYTAYHLVFKKEAILPIEVQLASLRVLASGRETPKEKLQQRILDLERLELDRASAIEYYATQAERRRQKFNEGLKDKELKRVQLFTCCRLQHSSLQNAVSIFQFAECNFRSFQDASDHEELCDAQEELDDFSYLLDKAKSGMKIFQEEDESDDAWGVTTPIFPLVGKTQEDEFVKDEVTLHAMKTLHLQIVKERLQHSSLQNVVSVFQFAECNFRSFQDASDHEELCDAQEELDDFSYLLDKAKSGMKIEDEFVKDQVTLHAMKTLHLLDSKRKVENELFKHEDVEVQCKLDAVQKMLVEEGGSRE
ncbi:hypothetical protein L7F22_045145 [Adiantum nelumboides]|nr:hypothetical protein [Adiantum nelumboides]